MKVWLHIKFGISCILFSMIYIVQVLAIDVIPTDFPLYPFDPVGKEKAQMKLTVDYVKYPVGTTDASFPTLDRRVPESAVAENFRSLKTTQEDLTPFLNLYLPEKKTEAEIYYKENMEYWANIKKIELLERFDIGSEAHISCKVEGLKGPMYFEMEGIKKLLGYIELNADKSILMRIRENYFLASLKINLNSLHEQLLGIITRNFPKDGLLNNYKYTLTIPSPVQSDPPELHPMKVSFNGTIYKILIDEKTEPEDKITEFMKKVVLTYRNGSDEEWFSLWLKDEAGEWVSLAKEEGKDIPEWASYVPAAYPYHAERNRFDKDEKIFLLYKIDFGPNVLVFYQRGTEVKKDKNGKITNVKPLYFWKDYDGKYQLTEGSSPGSNVTRFSGNIAAFFESELFLNFLIKQLQTQQSNVGK